MTTTNPLTFGIIGAGLMGKRRALSIMAAPGTKILLVADTSLEKAQALAQQCDCDATTDADALVARADIDCVIVCTTTEHLAKYTIAALAHGKHVLVEKPLAMRLDDARAVVAAAERAAGKIVKVGFNHRYLPTIMKAVELYAGGNGAIGKLMFIKATYGQKGRIGYEKEWRAFTAHGGGELLDQGVHVLDLCARFMGPLDPETTRGIAERLFWGGDADDNAFFVVKNAAGVPASIHVSSSLWRNTFRFEMQGTLGRIEIEGIRSHYGAPKLTLLTRNEQKSVDVGVYQFDEQAFTFPDEDTTWTREMESFLASVRSGAPVDGSPREALEALEVVFALHANNVHANNAAGPRGNGGHT